MMSSMDDCLKVYFVSFISLCIVAFLNLVSFVSVSRVGPCSRRAVIRQHLFVSWLGLSPCLLFYLGSSSIWSSGSDCYIGGLESPA